MAKQSIALFIYRTQRLLLPDYVEDRNDGIWLSFFVGVIRIE